jgi:CDP-diacylglycerol--glycerol-3-phosphate 3-phosphatidyltransferase
MKVVTMFKSINLPTLLTLIRLIVSPLVLPLLLVYLLPLNFTWLNALLALLFLGMSITDFFDGYLARRYQQETRLGKLLDPLADKFLTYSALIALLAVGKIYFYWVILLIGREFFVMGLRNVALEYNFSIQVSDFAKLKTALLMFCIAFIIFNPYQDLSFKEWRWNGAEVLLLAITILFSLSSAQRYYTEFLRCYRVREEQGASKDQHADR